MVDEEKGMDASQLPLGMSYSTAYSLGIESTPGYSSSTLQDSSDYNKDSDQEDSDGRRRGGNFERDLRGDRESRRYAPYSTGRQKSRVSSSALKDLRIYVSNIPYTTRWQELKDYMKKVGEVSFVEIFEDEKGRSKGCGVVEFKSKEDADKAILEYNGKDFQGRLLQVREDRVEEDSRMHRSKLRGNTVAQNSSGNILANLPALLGITGGNMKSNDPSACTVFVSNLDFKVTWQKLKDAFRCAGTVVRANIKEDDNQKSKGYGTVQFETPMEALTAVSMLNGQMLMDRPITVRMDRNAGGSLGGSMGSSSRQASQALQANPLASAASNPMALLNILQSLQGLTTLAQLGNLGGNLGASLGANLGASLGGGLGASLGSSLGNTATSQTLGAISNPSTAIGATGVGTMGAMGTAMGLDASNLAALTSLGGMMSQLGSTAGVSPSALANSAAYGPTENTSGKQVFVRNLPWKYTWQDLKDKFRAAGKVVRADILTENGGRSKGCGVVVFETPEEAQRAIALFCGMNFDGREIDVRLDRFG